ncbi:MAG: hypothetical protein J5873_04660 [Bacteroidales bacterium]|nr:hypothetical protein [Bacteroidales bacterium]
MANQFDPKYIEEQERIRKAGERAEREAMETASRRKTEPQPKPNTRVSAAGKRIRALLGGEFLGKVDFRRNMPYIVMVFIMVIVLIYINLLAQSNQKRLELLDKERIKLNDKYIQVMDQRELLYVDETRKEALLQVFKEKGFVDDSSIVYLLGGGKEAAR